jgi:Clp protease
MSQESVDLITRAFEWTYTDDSFEGILPIYHPDLVYHPRAVGVHARSVALRRPDETRPQLWCMECVGAKPVAVGLCNLLRSVLARRVLIEVAPVLVVVNQPIRSRLVLRSGASNSRACGRKLDEIIAKHTKQPLEKVSQDTDRDYFMSAEEAVEYNIIDRVIAQH